MLYYKKDHEFEGPKRHLYEAGNGLEAASGESENTEAKIETVKKEIDQAAEAALEALESTHEERMDLAEETNESARPQELVAPEEPAAPAESEAQPEPIAQPKPEVTLVPDVTDSKEEASGGVMASLAGGLSAFAKALSEGGQKLMEFFKKGMDWISEKLGFKKKKEKTVEESGPAPEALPALEALELPLSGFPLSSDFATDRINPVDGKHRPHHGLDIAMPEGTPLKSPGAGRVLFVNEAKSDSAGWYAEVEYNVKGVRKVMRVMHMKEKSLLQRGQVIQAGDLIGYSGNTGRSSGPHLHVEVRSGGVWGQQPGSPEDPYRYVSEALKAQIREERAGKSDPIWEHEHKDEPEVV